MVIKKEYIGSYGIIIENNEIILVKKANGGYKGKLDLPGGGIMHNETPMVTLKREIKEEAGLEVLECTLYDVTSTNIKWQMDNGKYEDLHHIGVLYLVNAQGNLKTTPDGLDSLGAKKYAINKLKKDELTPFAIYALEKMGYLK